MSWFWFKTADGEWGYVEAHGRNEAKEKVKAEYGEVPVAVEARSTGNIPSDTMTDVMVNIQ